MRRLIVLFFVLTPCAMAQEAADGCVVLTLEQRMAIVKKMVDMQTQIDDLEYKLHQERERSLCT